MATTFQAYDDEFEHKLAQENKYYPGYKKAEEDGSVEESPSHRACKKCGEKILEGHAYELGDDRWHINCFRCSKCENLLGINSDFLVVGTGELICEDCFYDCQVCGRKIGDLAILAGNTPYCADCFVCKHCKLRIDNLRYAKTLSGLYCMTCHEKVVQRKKLKEAEKRKDKQRRAKRANGGLAPAPSASASRNTTPIYEKSLPLIPPKGEGPHDPNASLASFTSPFELEDIDLEGRTSPTIQVPAVNKRQSINSVISKHMLQTLDEYLFNPFSDLKTKPEATKDKVTNQTVDYELLEEEPISLLHPPKKKPSALDLGDAIRTRPQILSRAANNRKMVYVDQETDSEVSNEALSHKVKQSSDSLKHLSSGSTTPRASKFLEAGSKLGRSLSIKSPKALLMKHRRTNSAADSRDELLDGYGSNGHSRSNSDILSSYALETSTIRQEESDLKNAKLELISTTSQVSTLKDEVVNLMSARDSLHDEVSELNLTMQKLRFQLEKERAALESTRAQVQQQQQEAGESDGSKHSTSLDSDYKSRSASENSINDSETAATTTSIFPAKKPPPPLEPTPGFSVQPYSSDVLTPTLDDEGELAGQGHPDSLILVDSFPAQAIVKSRVKPRFWKGKGFSKQKDSAPNLKISAPVLQNLDEKAFEEMSNRNKQTPTSKSKGIGFLDKFSNSMTSSISTNNLNGELVAGIKSPIKSATMKPEQFSLVSLSEKAARENRDAPNLVVTCIKTVEKHGLHSEGVYRKSGSTSQILALEQAFENLGDLEATSDELEVILLLDVNVVTSVLKRYLRRVPEPVITYGLYEQFISCSSIKRIDKKLEKIKTVVDQLPQVHRVTLFLICKHLHLISQYSEANLMNLHNLAIVFAPSLVRDRTGDREVADMISKNDVTECLVKYYSQVF